MTLKKKEYDDAVEVAIFDEALIYKRGEYWQFRMWLAKEGVQASLTTRLLIFSVYSKQAW